MKLIRKLTPKRKKSKIAKVAKVAIPVAGAVAAKHLWDKEGKALLGKAGAKVLDKTEEVQGKVQKFHDIVQNSMEKAVHTEEVAEEAAVQEQEEIFCETDVTENK